jgi:Zn-dependent metalloprotease
VPTRYSGNQTIWTNNDPGGSTPWELYESNVSGRKISTLNNHHSALLSGDPFTDNDNNWTLAEHSADNDDVALDIHWAQEKCYDYFKTVHNRNGWYNSTNYFETAYYHFRFDGASQANSAFWKPSTSSLSAFMMFGDGDATHSPYGSLDIVAHEYGHAIWEFTAGNTVDGETFMKNWGAAQEGF